jgi:hypothetical protein
LKDLEERLSRSPTSELFTWTLTHSTKAFSEIQPIFNSRAELLNYLPSYKSEQYHVEITRIAQRKVSDEWSAWVIVHSDMAIDEQRLDNMLMMVLYRLILKRDNRRCVICSSSADLTIHHIIPKQRNTIRKAPPFGRSVPTNLITLCRYCHSNYEPFVV